MGISDIVPPFLGAKPAHVQ